MYAASSLGDAEPPLVVGASFVLDTTISKSSLTDPPWPSSQVTLTERVPTLALSGVPVNCLSFAVNVSQPGSAFPLVSVAVYVQEAPESASAKVLAANV